MLGFIYFHNLLKYFFTDTIHLKWFITRKFRVKTQFTQSYKSIHQRITSHSIRRTIKPRNMKMYNVYGGLIYSLEV